MAGDIEFLVVFRVHQQHVGTGPLPVLYNEFNKCDTLILVSADDKRQPVLYFSRRLRDGQIGVSSTVFFT